VTLGRILDAGPATGRPGGTALGAVPTGHEVRLHQVSFAYGPHAEPVLRDLDLLVPEGGHLAVVGPSGIGKSTLAALVCGVRTPTRGHVLLGRVPPGQLSAGLLAQTRVLIPQEAYVFSGTVGANLTYLAPTAPDQRIERAIEALGAGGLVEKLGGLAAAIHPAQLSAGERQLIALVRAYLSPAPLAVLDEATCHLDPEAERRAEEAFAARPGSLIVVAHRISSALRARRILVLDGSKASLGRHRTLLQTSPLYRDLLGHWQTPNPSDDDQIQPAS
jgi:ATP-binding cassette subfamily C protein